MPIFLTQPMEDDNQQQQYYIKEYKETFIGGEKVPSYDESHYKEGIRRVKNEKDKVFEYYYNDTNKKVNDGEDIERIKKLRIPQTWDNVWINRDPNYRIQVIGIDPHKKKQYLYTKAHKDNKKNIKYQTLEKVIKLIDKINLILEKHQKLPKYDKNRVLSTMLLIIMKTGIRAGKEFYAKKNDTYGLCSLRKKHINFDDNKKQIILKFKGKKNVEHVHKVLLNGNEYDEMKNLMDLYYNKEDGKNDKLFNCVVDKKTIRLNEFDLNDYIHEYIDKTVTIKDFRTYLVNVFFIQCITKLTNEIFKTKDEINVTKIKAIIKKTIQITAEFIQHTPAICKSSYLYEQLTEFYKLNVDYFMNNKNKKPNEMLKEIINKK